MKALLNLLGIADSFYVLLALMLYLLQGKMVFLSNMPSRELTASPKDIGLEFESITLTTSDEERLHGWFVPADSPRGVVLFFHGNAGNISHRLDSIANSTPETSQAPYPSRTDHAKKTPRCVRPARPLAHAEVYVDNFIGIANKAIA